MAESEITVELLKDIREAARGTNLRLDTFERAVTDRLDAASDGLHGVSDRLDVVASRLDGVAERLELVESTLLDVAEQNQLQNQAVVGYMRSLGHPGGDLEPRVRALEARVDKLESR